MKKRLKRTPVTKKFIVTIKDMDGFKATAREINNTLIRTFSAALQIQVPDVEVLSVKEYKLKSLTKKR